MTREEFRNLFVELDWKKYVDDGDTVLTRSIVEKKIWATVNIHSNDSIMVDACISIDVFDKFDHIIGDRDVDWSGKRVRRRYAQGSIICQDQWRQRQDGFDQSDAIFYSEKILEWAASVDIEAGLAALRALPTDCLGAMPVRHLAALAVAGDVDTLDRYRDNFAAGDRMDFVPYINEGYIARALELAEKRKADPNWMPDKPKMRV